MLGKKVLIAIALLVVSSAVRVVSRTDATRPEAVATVQTVEVATTRENVEPRESAPAPAQVPIPRPSSVPAISASVASVQSIAPSPSEPPAQEPLEARDAERAPAYGSENSNEPYQAGKVWEIHESELQKFEASTPEERVAMIEENHRIRGLPELSPEETQALIEIQKQMEFSSQQARPDGIHERFP